MLQIEKSAQKCRLSQDKYHKINIPMGHYCLLEIEIFLRDSHLVKGQIVNILGLRAVWSAIVAKAAIDSTRTSGRGCTSVNAALWTLTLECHIVSTYHKIVLFF